MSGIVGSKINIRGSGRIAKLGTDGQVLTSSGAGKPANYEDGATSYDDDAVRDDIATLALHQATDANAAKYNLVNTSVDQFEDSTGVTSFTDCSRSSSEYVSTVGDGTQVDFTADGTWTRGSATKAKVLLVAGGGGGGTDAGGGGGAGGLVSVTDYAVSGTDYAVDIGDGGAGAVNNPNAGTNGEDTTFIGATTLTAKGGGGGGSGGAAGVGADGGSGGGAGGGYSTTGGMGNSTQSAQSGDSGTYGFGFEGIEGATGSPGKGGGGGGGAGAAPVAIWTTVTGSAGGAGKDMSASYGTGVGDSGWFAGGAGAGCETSGTTAPGNAGGLGGGGTGGGPATGSPNATAGTANTGGGGGGGKNLAGAGGSGFLSVIPEESNATGNFISTDSTALASVSSMGIVMTYKNASGTNTLNTDVIAEVSANGGTNYTTTVLVAGGTFSTGILQAIANDVSVTAGTAIRYRISFANQSDGSKIAQIYGVSLMY
jgi:hypothetical protein